MKEKQTSLWDTPPTPSPHSGEGERRKAVGIARAVASKESEVGLCREVAHDIAHGKIKHADGRLEADMLCSADDVAAWWERRNDHLEREGKPRLPWIGDACGGLFEKHNWQSTGYIKSKRPGSHANPIIQWRWKHG